MATDKTKSSKHYLSLESIIPVNTQLHNNNKRNDRGYVLKNL